MDKFLDHKNMIPLLKAFVWVLGLLCATYGLVVAPKPSNEHFSVIVSILSGYGIILLDSFVSFIDIAKREDNRVFKASIFLIFAVIVFHFATTFPLTFMLYNKTDLCNPLFTAYIAGTIIYVALYKWFVEYIDKHLDFWTAIFKVRSVSSKM